MNKLVVTTWGAAANTLRTKVLSLVYSTAEYCVPVWKGSRHTALVDVQLNQAMRSITGTVKPTNTEWLPTLANIQLPDLRKKSSTLKEYNKITANQDLPLLIYSSKMDTDKLKSRKSFCISGIALADEGFDAN